MGSKCVRTMDAAFRDRVYLSAVGSCPCVRMLLKGVFEADETYLR